VITYQPKGAGMMPEFQSNSYEAKCPAQGAKAQFKPTDKAMNK
jgi:hypothetical protein